MGGAPKGDLGASEVVAADAAGEACDEAAGKEKAGFCAVSEEDVAAGLPKMLDVVCCELEV